MSSIRKFRTIIIIQNFFFKENRSYSCYLKYLRLLILYPLNVKLSFLHKATTYNLRTYFNLFVAIE